MTYPPLHLLLLAVSGSGLAVVALALDNCARLGPPRLAAAIRRLGAKVRIRRDAGPIANLRQGVQTISTVLLLTLALFGLQAVYIALEVLMVASCLTWYVKLHLNEAKSEKIKLWMRIVLMLLAWGVLEIFNQCPGYHRIGVLGFELLGLGFIMHKPAWRRDLLCCLGGVSLCTYSVIGLTHEPENFLHFNFAVLNGIYSVLGVIATYTSIRHPQLGADVDPNAA